VKWLNRLDKKEISDVGENDHALHRMMLRAFPIMPIEEDEDDHDESSSEDGLGEKKRRAPGERGPWERQYSMSSRTSQNAAPIIRWWWKFQKFADWTSAGSGTRGSARFSSSGRRRGSNELKHLSDYRASTLSGRSMGKAQSHTSFFSQVWRLFMSSPHSSSSPSGSGKDKQLAQIAPSGESDGQ